MGVIDERGEGSVPSGPGGQWCALCGASYVAGVVECDDCLVPLVDNPPLPAAEIGDEDGEQLAYEFDDLPAADRFAIDRDLAAAGIVHAWDGTTLLVAPYDEEDVDRVLGGPEDDELDDRLLDEDAELVVYDLEDWDDAMKTDLDGRLEAEGIAHAFDEHGDLVVLESDEEKVDEIVDAIDHPDQLPIEDEGEGAGDGLAAIDAVGELFVAADRLVHDPSDPEGVLAAADASRTLESMSTPFGFGPALWEELVAKGTALRELLEAETELVDDDQVAASASELRAALRPYV